MNDKIRERIAKIKALAEKGVDGEQKNAQKKLEKLAKKYNLSSEEISDINKKTYKFKYSKQIDCDLFSQLVKYFLPNFNGEMYKNTWGVREIEIDLEYLDWVTLDCSYEYFRKHMKTQYDKFVLPKVKRCRTPKTKAKKREELSYMFFSKYIIASGIYHKNQLIKPDSLSLKELIIASEMSGIEGGAYKKQVDRGLYLEN